MPEKLECESKFGIYTFDLSELGLRIRLDRIHERGDSISGEVTIENTAGDHIHTARLSLLDTAKKRSLASHLAKQINSLNWDTIIEGVSQAVIVAHRKGEPVIEIGQIPKRHTPRWRLEGIIPEGDITIMFGAGGTGKSMLALCFALSVQHGWSGLGLTPEAGNVLYLDWEWGWEEHNERLKSIEAGMELDFSPNIAYRYCHRALDTEIQEIHKIVIDRDIKLIIVDSAIPALGGAKEAKENSEPLFQALRSMPGATSLIISHQSKDPEQKVKSPYGDVFFVNRARHVLEARSVMDSEDEIKIALYKHKSNLPPSLLRNRYPIGFHVAESDLGTTIESLDVRSVPELAERMSITSRIINAIKLQPSGIKVAELAEALNVKPKSISQSLWRGKGRIFTSLDPQLKESRWALLSKETDSY
ncbi:hypothetical protein LCGC14_0498600 [marine sediment metagenome]|uniref:Uncharacterized protein n=1 Tax=marine sediment metagenome TaxID=412755 RepID=A0A0F9URH9_9ZZZZ